MAQAFKGKDGTLAAFVLPKFVNSEDRLYSVDDVFNGIITKTSFADTHFFVGRGAGAYPTASAVLSDISALGYNYKYEYKKIYQKEDLILSDDVLLKVLVRHKKEDSEAVKVYFETVEELYTNNDSGYITGNINLQSIKEVYSAKGKALSIILIGVLAKQEIKTEHEAFALA